jgi:putative mRNA 3-end processing factor
VGNLLEVTESGLYCAAGDFYVDPWRPVPRAVITHLHADHARWGCGSYLMAEPGLPIARVRLGTGVFESLPYGGVTERNGVRVSFHPAGHLLGSAQVRVEYRGEVWVVSGDYKTVPERTCAPFEPVRCDVFITESTFGLPVYRWRRQEEVLGEINDWWRENAARGLTSVLFAYALGKAQRLLAGINPAIGPLLVHGSVVRLNEAYREAGVAMPEAAYATAEMAKEHRGRALLIAPPSALGSPWLRKFAPYSLAMASGWMAIRGTRRRRAMDRGFVLSDHADWPGLLAAIEATGAERVGVTHGYTEQLVRYLRGSGRDAWVLPTRYEGEMDDADGGGEASP